MSECVEDETVVTERLVYGEADGDFVLDMVVEDETTGLVGNE